MVEAGCQYLLLNEYKKETSFYKMTGVEGDIRNIARKFHNSLRKHKPFQSIR